MKGNFMKKSGVVFLFFVSFLAVIMTWEMNLLSTLGGDMPCGTLLRRSYYNVAGCAGCQ
ncbi:hypothetical protein J2Z65_001522 [Paenibacillus aceris]|uniref:Uncharacterized protein n=1 Tax=Paenibacillus aceris TaxID=869555 RepID=A0ABS4HUL6_9BACL|nr:hypothetical protein [Paenibacillus aceris]